MELLPGQEGTAEAPTHSAEEAIYQTSNGHPVRTTCSILPLGRGRQSRCANGSGTRDRWNRFESVSVFVYLIRVSTCRTRCLVSEHRRKPGFVVDVTENPRTR